MVRLAIFDLDGTLVDSLEDLAFSVNSVLADYNIKPIASQEYKKFVGDGLRLMIERACRFAGLSSDAQTIDQMKGKFDVIYHDNMVARTRAYDGILQMLEALLERGVKIAVCSNKPQEFVGEIVDTLFPNIPMVARLGASEVTPRKPDPMGVNRIIEEIGVGKGEVLYIGDSSTDMKTAVNACVKAVGVSWGFRTRDELVSTGASVVIDSPVELLDLLGE